MKKSSLLFSCFVLGLIWIGFAFNAPRINRSSITHISDTLPYFLIKARDHKGQSVVSTNNVLRFTTGLHNDFYQADSNGKTGYLYIEAKMATLVNQTQKRVPLNLCIVIDRSGSMEGKKMTYAKQAARGIIERMQEEDIVSVVMYDNFVDSVQVPVRVTDKEAIYKQIDAIRSRGATNLWGGTEKGYEYVARNYKPGYVNRVLLISDGRANVGLVEPTQIRAKVQRYKDEQGITLSTFGVGLDYNETLMTEMAETGHGNYYFIDAPDKMAAMFDKELNGLLHVAAQEAELQIRMPAGTKALKSYPMKYTEEGELITIKLRDLFSDETRGTVFTFSIADGTNAVLKFHSKISYIDISDGQPRSIEHDNILKPVRNVDAYLTHFNKPVVEQVILSKANENLELAMAAADKGEYDQSNYYVESNRKFLKAHGGYMNTSYELRRMDTINLNYGLDLARARSLGADSVKKVQKASKDFNYRVRQKKD